MYSPIQIINGGDYGCWGQVVYISLSGAQIAMSELAAYETQIHPLVCESESPTVPQAMRVDPLFDASRGGVSLKELPDVSVVEPSALVGTEEIGTVGTYFTPLGDAVVEFIDADANHPAFRPFASHNSDCAGGPVDVAGAEG